VNKQFLLVKHGETENEQHGEDNLRAEPQSEVLDLVVFLILHESPHAVSSAKRDKAIHHDRERDPDPEGPFVIGGIRGVKHVQPLVHKIRAAREDHGAQERDQRDHVEELGQRHVLPLHAEPGRDVRPFPYLGHGFFLSSSRHGKQRAALYEFNPQAIAPTRQRRVPARRWGREHAATRGIQVQNYLTAPDYVDKVIEEKQPYYRKDFLDNR
jgi:hypothetical protein